jgi:glycosyltransferase involved in cell wall biosynthesis
MKKIISIVLNNFLNDSRVLKENISLQKAGYAVKVIALHEEPLNEYETIQNISVHRIKLTSRNWSKSKLIQLFKYLEFAYRCIHQYRHSDIIHCNDLNTLPIGVIIKKYFNKHVKIVYDAHEYEIEINGLNGIQKTLAKLLEKQLIYYADTVITVSNAIADEYVKLYGIQKPAIVLNTPPYQEIEKKDIFRTTFAISKEQTIFLYQGGLSKGRGIEILLDTFAQLDQQSAIVFMGYGPLSILVQEYANKHANIFYHEAVSPTVLLDYTCSADFGILFYENNCLNHDYCSPNKMFEYLMAEIPVIVSNLYEMKKIVNDYQIGTVAENNTVEGLKNAIYTAQMINKQDVNKRIKHVKEIFNWEAQEKMLLNMYRALQ